MTTKEMSDFINSLWCWSRCTDEEQRKLSEIADYLSNQGNEKNDCISRIETIDYLCKHCPAYGECFKDCGDIKHLRQMSPVTPQEPKTGHWIEDSEQHHVEKTYHCSKCGHGAWGEYEKTEYCGGCGAKMVEPQESEGT